MSCRKAVCDFSGAFLDPELLGVGSLLKKYIALLCTHIGDILPVATSIASTGCRHFAEVSRVIEGDLTGKKKKIPSDLYFQHIYALEMFATQY